MVRDLEKYQKWEDWHRALALSDFTRRKNKEVKDAYDYLKIAVTDQEVRTAKGMIRVAEKMTFQFEKKGLSQYGRCSKFNKEVSFIPMHCQIETQDCFVHRKLA